MHDKLQAIEHYLNLKGLDTAAKRLQIQDDVELVAETTVLTMMDIEVLADTIIHLMHEIDELKGRLGAND